MRSGRSKDYVLELNAMREGLSIRKISRLLRRRLSCGSVEVVVGHKTTLHVAGVPRLELANALAPMLRRHGSALITRRRGAAATWLFRPSANCPIIRL